MTMPSPQVATFNGTGTYTNSLMYVNPRQVATFNGDGTFCGTFKIWQIPVIATFNGDSIFANTGVATGPPPIPAPLKYSQWLPNASHGRRQYPYPDANKVNYGLRAKLDYNLMVALLQIYDPYYTDSRVRSLTPNDIVFAYTTMFPDS